MASGVVTHIQRFSVHDGPGIRTTVFLKGCQMRCPWCHNPETYRRQPEIQVYPDRCIGCGACLAQCPRGAHEAEPGGHVFHRERCTACGRCAQSCFARSLVQVGQVQTAEEVVAEVLADRAFYHPEGGATLSGGEPLAQAEFAAAILALCRQEGIHTAVETNLAWPWETVASLVELVDLFLVDVKLMDETEHTRWTGISNRQTLENLRRLDAMAKPLAVRTPVVVGVSDRPEQIGAIADFLAALPHVRQYDLLPYHPLGNGKHETLGLGHAREFSAPGAAQMNQLAACATRPGLAVRVAGRSAWQAAESAK